MELFYDESDNIVAIEMQGKTFVPESTITTHEQQAVEKFLESQIEYEAEEYSVCPLCERELIWGETYCPDDRRKLITKTRNKLEWSNKNVVIKELTKFLEENPSA